MKRSIKPPTKAQQARQDKLRELGCICCHVDGWPGCQAEIHHINDAGRNISQDHTIPLCVWHHRGVQKWSIENNTGTRWVATAEAQLSTKYHIPEWHSTVSDALAIERFGPSMALSRKDFEAHYGTELVLLKKADAMI